MLDTRLAILATGIGLLLVAKQTDWSPRPQAVERLGPTCLTGVATGDRAQNIVQGSRFAGERIAFIVPESDGDAKVSPLLSFGRSVTRQQLPIVVGGS